MTDHHEITKSTKTRRRVLYTTVFVIFVFLRDFVKSRFDAAKN